MPKNKVSSTFTSIKAKLEQKGSKSNKNETMKEKFLSILPIFAERQKE